MTANSLSAVSFRDPAGFVYCEHGDLRRQVNRVYREHYDQLLASGLYDELVAGGLLIAHEELDAEALEPELAYKVIRPDRIEFVSYPYEWSFSQYQDAALLALEVQRRALARGMTLKDCSVYNVQFHQGRPIFIDTLSFQIYREGEPWVGYRQFCEHFLAPLALMSLVDHRTNQLCRSNIDGIPLDLAARILPWRSRLRWGLALHLHLHAHMQRVRAHETSVRAHQRKGRSHDKRAASGKSGEFSLSAQLGLIDSLRSTMSGLRWKPRETAWASYYQDPPYSAEELRRKALLVAEFLERTGSRSAWDLGANTGAFSELASSRGLSTIAFDFEPACVEQIYLQAKRKSDTRILPLIVDLYNPSPASGWLNEERASIFARGKTELVLALALVHHLVFSGNQPLENVAEFFDRLAPWLVIEFVSPADPEVASLRARRRGIHHPYDRDHFEKCFHKYFSTIIVEPVAETRRVLYLLRRRAAEGS